ncbi:MAG TPA: class I SAM-dependent methyltransferase [Vicinamibacterales bacterium]|jgi:SAM-dependent methyltransferase|nr:class I SAM-dependent methyltransferase [Vicinamibacterales bacterium]
MAADKAPLPAAVPPPDRSQIERLNTLYRIIEDAPAGGGLKARLASGARRLLGRVLSRQQEFNAALVDHINRNLPLQFEAHRATLGLIDWVSASVERCEDAKDVVEHHLQALLARERRNDAAVAALAAQHEELRAAVSVLQQAAHGLRRAIEELQANPTSQIPNSKFPPDLASRMPVPGEDPGQPPSQFAAADSYKYVGFEDQFRGSPEEIRKRVAEYLPIFEKTSDVLDVGCGRGEFLDLLRGNGVRARGIDVNAAMVDVCREKKLDAETADALTYLRGLPDGSLGGLFAAQVIEHLEPRYLTQLLDAAFDKLRPGAPIVLETINPACWFAFFESYIRDLTHVRPVHPDTLHYLLIATGFQHVDIKYRAPYPDAEKLQPVASPALGDLVETLNANVEKINRLLFTYLDYAAVGIRA